DRKRLRTPRLDRDRVAILELAHVELADGRTAIGPVRDAVDDEAAHPADAFAAVRVECDRILALLDEALVDDVEHLEKRHVSRNVVGDVVDHPSSRRRPSLSPDLQVQTHYL